MQISPLLTLLIDHLRALPGIGPKAAQRMAFYLLQRNRKAGIDLANTLIDAMENISHCEMCRTLTEQALCSICASTRRQQSPLLCVVESPTDIIAIEQTGQYNGRYFVLLGHLSPLDGVGPNDIGLDKLNHRLKTENISEVILATNPTIEGEATAHFIAQMCEKNSITATRIAHGVPVGGELEMVDGTTLSHSFVGRRKMTLNDQ